MFCWVCRHSLLVFRDRRLTMIGRRFMGLDLTSGKVIAGGDGNIPISWTSRRDVGRFVAYALTTLPSEKIAGRTFRVEGERAVRRCPSF